MQVTPQLPKTRSGKIMRRILRAIAENKVRSARTAFAAHLPQPNELGDTSTLADPHVVQDILAKKEALAEERDNIVV